MNRFASIATTAALAGSLIGTVSAANALSNLYMVPISDITATYDPTSSDPAVNSVRFSAVVDLSNSSFASLSIPFAAAWTDNEFGGPNSIFNGTSPFVDNPNSPNKDPNGKNGAFAFTKNAQSYTTTASKIGGNTVFTVQNTVGQIADVKGATTLALPSGTYTIGTFTFPLAPGNKSGFATIYLPTPFGFSFSANSSDGAFAGAAPTNRIEGKATDGSGINDPVNFFTGATNGTGGKYSSLKFKVANTPAPSSLLVIAMGAIPAIGLLRRRSAK